MKLFLIEAPFQLLCAKEADLYFDKDQPGYFVLLNLYGEQNLNQLQSLAEELQINNKLILSLDRTNMFDSLRTLRKEIEKFADLSKVDRVFLGDYRSVYFNLVINKLKLSSKIWLVDDGNVNYILLSKLENGNPHHKQPILIKKIYYWLKGYDASFYKPKGIFTFFGDQFIGKIKDLEIFQNNLEFLTSRLQKKSSSREIFLLGSKLVELGYVSSEIYLNKIDKLTKHLLNRFPGSAIKYIPHREEDSAKVGKVLEIENLELLQIDKPFEMFIIETKSLPSCIASFYSGALNTAKILLNNSTDILAYKLNSEDIVELRNKKEVVKNIQTCYLNFEDQNIEVVNEY